MADQIQNGSTKERVIDWDKVIDLLEAGCSGVQIAANLGIHPETLYDRTFTKYGKMWSDFSQEKRIKGDSDILQVQHKKAKSGDNTMLVWVGKNRTGLKQRDTPQEIEVSPATVGQFADIMKQLQSYQKSASNIETNTNSTETKSE
jgi:hypothetical protein